MLKKFASLLALAVLFVGLNPAGTVAKSGNAQTPPEISGTYDVPGHPNLKVRVFVHNPKPAKPGAPAPTPQPTTCSNPGTNAFVGATGWYLPSSVTYRLNPSSAPSYVSNLATITSEAFGEWTGAINNKVVLTRGADTAINRATYDGQNIIAWGRTSGSALAVTYTWYEPSTGQAVETDTIMNKKFFWASGCFANAYDAQDILTHELGHWFGLNDYYTGEYVDNTMFGYGSKAETKKNTLTTGDIAGINAIYQ